MNELTLMNVLLAIVFVLQIADWLTTRKALKLGFREMNPIAAKLIDKIGINATGVLKTALVTYMVYWTSLLFVSIGTVIIYTYVVGRNARKLREYYKDND